MIDEKTLPPLDAPHPPSSPPPSYIPPSSGDYPSYKPPSPQHQQPYNAGSAYASPSGPPPNMSQTSHSGMHPQPYSTDLSPMGTPAPHIPTPSTQFPQPSSPENVQTMQTVNGGTQLSYTGQPGYFPSSQPQPQFPSPSPTPANGATSPGNNNGLKSPYPPPPNAPSPGANTQNQSNLRSPYPSPPAQPVNSPPPGNAPPMLYVQNNAASVGDQFRQELFARCARGDHDVETRYGPCGIITAILCFPIGLICLFIDTEKKCSRCGTVLA